MAAAHVKAFAGRAAVLVSSELFSLGGSRSTLREYDFERHWRNARTHTTHSPLNWTDYHVGNWILNGTRPPMNGHI